ncbi:MAG TPA: cytidine deaminase [Alphaproteobacteria bacterium]|nr:cytidine deaminase [Alphaproteobacteria bacterium]
MSFNPFVADDAIRSRIDALAKGVGPQVRSRVETLLGARRHAPADNLGSVLPREDVATLVAQFGLAGPEELMLLTLKCAETIARPPISKFYVGAIGLERETGALIFGGNVEFPGTHLGFTLHGEGFVFTRAFSRGTTVETLALGEAHPCGHCRQFLSEFAAIHELTLIDPLGHRLQMADLLPWPFDPAYLGETGAMPGTEYTPSLEVGEHALPDQTVALLLHAGRRAYAPYSRCPGAVVLTLHDGAMVAGATIESVAYNPTIGPLQAALVDLIAHGYDYGDIESATLGTPGGEVVDYTASTSELLARIAPDAPLTAVSWQRR